MEYAYKKVFSQGIKLPAMLLLCGVDNVSSFHPLEQLENKTLKK
jgi:hypothetical protein